MQGQSQPAWNFEVIGDGHALAHADATAPNICAPTTAGTGSEVGRPVMLRNRPATGDRMDAIASLPI